MSNTTLDDVLYEFALNPAIATSRELLMARTIVNLREQLVAVEATMKYRADDLHPFWETASREQLADGFAFQGATTRAAFAEIEELTQQLTAAQKTGDPELLEAARSFLTAMTYERNEKEVALYKVVRARMDTTATEVV